MVNQANDQLSSIHKQFADFAESQCSDDGSNMSPKQTPISIPQPVRRVSVISVKPSIEEEEPSVITVEPVTVTRPPLKKPASVIVKSVPKVIPATKPRAASVTEAPIVKKAPLSRTTSNVSEFSSPEVKWSQYLKLLQLHTRTIFCLICRFTDRISSLGKDIP
jgi:hypothetical protein